MTGSSSPRGASGACLGRMHLMPWLSAAALVSACTAESPPPIAACGALAAGRTVTPGGPPALADVWVGPSIVVAVGAAGTVGVRDDARAAWCWTVVDAATDWRAVWGSGDDDVWLVGTAGAVVHYDGTAFTPVAVGATAALAGVWGTGQDDVWLVGAAGTVRHFDGAAWASHDLAADQTLLAVWSASSDDVWIAGTEPAPYPGNPSYDGSSGIVYRWAPTTATWGLELRDTRYYGVASFLALHGSDGANLWAVGVDHPAGAACGIAGLARRDGAAWDEVAGAPTECSTLADVAAGAPGATDGAWVVGSREPGRAASGTSKYAGGVWTYYSGDAITDHLIAIAYRGDRMWAIGRDDAGDPKIIRWDGAGWIAEE